ncbi:MAG: hypothetical protein Q8Q09_10280 [Deltaproteobacteria bacterium]|nr:hypothetical protein [Deltaproteobacteria bacterium]
MRDSELLNEPPPADEDENGVDLTLIRWFLTLTPRERLSHLAAQMELAERVRNARKSSAR